MSEDQSDAGKPVEFEDEDYRKMYPGFTITCQHCGSTHVEIDNSLGFSAESGSWGSIDLICDRCGAASEIIGS